MTKVVVFPANEFIDPKVKLVARLTSEKSQKVLTTRQVVLAEDSDFNEPMLSQAGKKMVLSGFDSRNPDAKIEFALP